jgi:hypothetical protein
MIMAGRKDPSLFSLEKMQFQLLLMFMMMGEQGVMCPYKLHTVCSALSLTDVNLERAKCPYSTPADH